MFVVFIGLVTAGVMQGVKNYREFKKPQSPQNTAAQIAAVTILENVTLSAWTASNKEVVAGLERLCNMLSKHTDEVADLRREMEDARHERRRGGGI